MKMLRSSGDLEGLVLEYGFLPFFRNEISGFSVEERTAPELWFSDDADGPWEWKGPVARKLRCCYGKLFRNRAGFVSLDWLPELANYRRDGYDFDARFDDGLAPQKDKKVYDKLSEGGSVLSKRLKADSGYGPRGMKGFEGIITRLQMQCYVNIADFEYMTDKNGNTYGWGVARYSTPEYLFGPDAVRSAYFRDPMESARLIVEHLSKKLPNVSTDKLEKLIRR